MSALTFQVSAKGNLEGFLFSKNFQFDDVAKKFDADLSLRWYAQARKFGETETIRAKAQKPKEEKCKARLLSNDSPPP